MIQFQPFYVVSVVLGITLLAIYPTTRRMTEATDRRRYYILQGITLVGAVLGAKVSVLYADLQWPWRAIENWPAVLGSGRSIMGGLLGGFAAAELSKPLLGYHLPPNDRFAAILPFSIGIGRIGCLLTGCCRGIPYDGLGAITYSDRIPRHPAAAYELAFQLAVGTLFLWLERHRLFPGRLFAIYLVAYGAFRFVIEPVRETPKVFSGFSGYQWLAMTMILTGIATLILRRTPAETSPPRNPEGRQR